MLRLDMSKDDDRYQTAHILWESAWEQGKCLGCQSDWSYFYDWHPHEIWDIEVEDNKRNKEKHWDWSR